MPSPAKFIDILSEHTVRENMFCDECLGLGEIRVSAPDTGSEPEECPACLGTGFNQLGLILHGILKPPEEGYGPVALQEAIQAHLQAQEQHQAILEAQAAIAEAQQAITSTQEAISQAQALLHARFEENNRVIPASLVARLKRLADRQPVSQPSGEEVQSRHASQPVRENPVPARRIS